VSVTEALFLREMGTGPEPAVMLHCGLGVSGMWRPVAKALEHRLHMRAPDLLGHGRSPDFGAGDVHDQCCDAIRPLLAERTQLIGHSFGATLALRLALEAPDRVASLMLIEPVFFAAARGSAEHAAHYAVESPIFDIFASGDRHETARRFNQIWGGGVAFDDVPQAVQDTMARQMDFVVGTKDALWDDHHGMLSEGGLERLTMPVTCLRGAQTVPIIAHVHQGLLARLPNASEAVIARAGHMLVTTHAAEVAAAILTHLDRV